MHELKELDSVVLLKDLSAYHLSKGDIGTVVHLLDEHTFEVEFTNDRGETTAILPLQDTDIMRLNLKLLHT